MDKSKTFRMFKQDSTTFDVKANNEWRAAMAALRKLGFSVNEIEEVKINKKELTDQIYDTLAGNPGFSINHVAFNPDCIQESQVDSSRGEMHFLIDGVVYRIQVSIGLDQHMFDDGQY